MKTKHISVGFATTLLLIVLATIVIMAPRAEAASIYVFSGDQLDSSSLVNGNTYLFIHCVNSGNKARLASQNDISLTFSRTISLTKELKSSARCC